MLIRRTGWMALSLAIIALATSTSRAADVTWTQAVAGGTWDNVTPNWSTGVWANNAAAADGAIFAATGIGTSPVVGPINARSINFTSTGWSLSGGGGTIDLFNTGASTLGAGQISVGTGTATINVPIGGSIGMTKSGAGTLILGGSSTYSGNTTVINGTLQLGANNVLPSTTDLVLGDASLSNGLGLFNMNGFNQTVNSLTFIAPSTGTTRLAGAGTMTVNGPISFVNNLSDPGNDFPVTGNTALDLGGAVRNINVQANANTTDLFLNGVISNGGINFVGGQTTTTQAGLNLGVANTYSGATTINNGNLRITTLAGNFNNSTAVNIVNNGLFNEVNGVGFTSFARINDAATVTLNYGAWTIGSSGAATTDVETFDKLAFTGGESRVTMTVSTGQRATLLVNAASASLPRSGAAVALISASNLGQGAAINANNGYVQFTDPTSVTGQFVGATATFTVGTPKNLGIVPWMVGNTSGTATVGSSFVGFNSNAGVNSLMTLSPTASFFSTTFTAGENTSMAAAFNVLAPVSINSLLNTATSALTLTGSLSIASGALLNTSGTLTVNGPSTISFGSEGVISVSGTSVIMNAALSGTTTITKAGLGLLTLSANNAAELGGGMTIHNGNLTLTNVDAAGGAASKQIRFTRNIAGTGTAQVFGINLAASGTVANDLQFSRTFGNTTISNLSAGITEVTLSGALSTAAGMPTSPLSFTNTTVGSFIKLTNAGNTNVGTVTLSSGGLAITSNAALGNAANQLTLNNGTNVNGGLRFDAASIDVARPVALASSTRIDVTNFSGTISGVISGIGGAGGVTVAGGNTNTLNLTGVNTTTSIMNVVPGATPTYVAFSGNGSSTTGGAMNIGNSTAVVPVVTFDNTATNVNNRYNTAAAVNLNNGGLDVIGNAGVATTQNFGALTVSAGNVQNVLNILSIGQPVTTTFASLTAIPGTSNVLFAGTNLGSPSFAGGVSHIFFSTPPTLVNGAIPNATFSGFGGIGGASYDNALGVILFVSVAGSFIDNFNNVGPGSITPTDANFFTNAPTTANLDATIKSLTMANDVNLVNAGYGAGTTLNITGVGGISSNTAVVNITGAGTVSFGAGVATFGTTTNLGVAGTVTLFGTGGLTKNGAAELAINGPNNITGPYNVAAGTLSLNTGATMSSLTSTGGTTTFFGAPVVLNGNTGATFTASGAIIGAAGLSTAAGFTNVQVLSNNNALYTGQITINGGTITASNLGAFGPATNPAVIVNNGGTAGLQGTIALNALPMQLSGAGAAGRSGALDNILNANTYAGAITLNAASTIGVTAGTLGLSGGITGVNTDLTLNTATGTTLTLSAVATNIGAGQLNKIGAGLAILPNLANTMGNQNVTGGTLRASADNNLGAAANVMTLDGGTFQFGAAFNMNAARAITLGAAHGTIDSNALVSSIDGPIGGAGNLTKISTGTVTLNSANGYLGTTTIRNGVLQMGINQAIPNTALTIGNSAASDTSSQLNLNGFNVTVPSLTIFARGSAAVPVVAGAGVLTVNGNISYVDNAVSAGNAFQGNIAATVTAIDLGGAVRNISIAGQNNGVNPGDFSINTVIQNGGINYSGNLSVPGGVATGMTLNAAVPNTYAGGTTVNVGQLNVAATTNLGTGGLAINQAGVAVSNVSINSSMTISSLSTGAVAVPASAQLVINGAASVLNVDQLGNTSFNGVISGTGGLTKNGVGTLELMAGNTYTGPTIVDSGLLRVKAPGSIVSNTTVNGAGRFGGTGVIAGTLFNNGGVFEPGASVGTLTSTNNTAAAATFATGANWQVEFDHADTSLATVPGTSHDFFFNNGNASVLNLGATLNFELIGTPGSSVAYSNGVPVSYTVATFNNATIGNGINAPGTVYSFDTTNFAPTGDIFVTSYIYAASIVGNSLVLTITPVPEPATVLALCAAGAGAFGLIRRRLKKGKDVLAV